MNFDSVLYITEAADPRIKFGGKPTIQTITNWYGMDPNSQLSYGTYIKNALETGFDRSYSVKVTDMGSDVIVDVTCHNQLTGRSASKIFLIKLKNKSAQGWVKSSSNRYRSINGVD